VNGAYKLPYRLIEQCGRDRAAGGEAARSIGDRDRYGDDRARSIPEPVAAAPVGDCRKRSASSTAFSLTREDLRPLRRAYRRAARPVKVAHNAKFDGKFLRHHLGMELDGVVFDTYLASLLAECRKRD
jgi:hypothetical protein